MKLTINSTSDRIKLIKFLRSYYTNLTLKDAIDLADNLPSSFEDLSKADCNDVKKQILDYTSFSVEEEEKFQCDFGIFNININPPEEFLDALAWYDSCSDEHKAYIEQIISWRSRTAVC